MIFDIHSEVELIHTAFAGKTIGLTSGSFDLFHHLHLVYLQRCRRLCDVLIVGVDSNDLVTLRKRPPRPLVPEHQRVAIVAALKCVDAAFILGSVEEFGRAVECLGVKRIFKNETFRNEKVLGGDRAEVVIIPDVKQHSSTTQMIEEILKHA